MRLVNAARAFDSMPCADGYTGKHAFFAQLALYDDTKRDSESGQRRVLSTGPDVVIPPRGVVAAAGTRYIVGHKNPDVYAGKVIRVGWVGHEATDLVIRRTLLQACQMTGGLPIWTGRAWVKNLADNGQSSALTPQANVHFSPKESIEPEDVIVYPNGMLLLVRTVHDGPAGTRIALSDQMPGVEQCLLTAGAYDRMTETWSGSTQNVTVLKARWQSLFNYRSATAPKFGPDDLQVILAGTHDVKPGAKLTLSSGSWQIDSALAEDGVWKCRAVRHG